MLRIQNAKPYTAYTKDINWHFTIVELFWVELVLLSLFLCVYSPHSSTINRMQKKINFFSEVQLVWIQSFLSARLVVLLRLKEPIL